MIRRVVLIVLSLFCLEAAAAAVEVPEELRQALPRGVEEVLEDVDFSASGGLAEGIRSVWENLKDEIGEIFRQRLKGAASILIVVVLCSVVGGVYHGTGSEKVPLFLPMAGALSVTMLTAGSLDTLVGLGSTAISDLSLFSKALLPTLAAATAASGAITSATMRQVTTVFFVDLLLNLINGLLMPMVYLYIGTLAASSCLPDYRLGALAEALKKVIVWMLTMALLGFTVYLSVAGIFSTAVDGASVKVAKAAISGVVPVVGGIIAEASETVLAGAGLLKSTIGLFGVLAILAVCAYPFFQLGIQYLLYKLTAFLAATVGDAGLCKLIDGLGGAFGLVLGMTGSCALLLVISILASVAAVMP